MTHEMTDNAPTRTRTHVGVEKVADEPVRGSGSATVIWIMLTLWLAWVIGNRFDEVHVRLRAIESSLEAVDE